MNLRRKFDGVAIKAQLGLHMLPNHPRKIVLVLAAQTGDQQLLGPLAAAIGYELVDCSPAERAALLLAGFQLATADTPRKGLCPVSKLLSAANVRTRRSDRATRSRTHLRPKSRTPSPQPCDGNGRSANSKRNSRWKTHTQGPHTRQHNGVKAPRARTRE